MSKSHSQKGFTPITSEQVEIILALLAKAQAPLGEVVALSAAARKGAPKLRRGAQQVIPTIAVLAEKHGFVMPSLPINDMTSKIEHAQRLREVLGAVSVFQKLLKDEILASEGDGWQTATATYSMLRRAAKSRPELRVELSPVEHPGPDAHGGCEREPQARAGPPSAGR